MLVHEFITIRPEIREREEIDYLFFVKYREDPSVIRRWMRLSDDVVLAHYGFKREDFRVSGMTTENFYPELMKFFSSFIAETADGRKHIGLCYWGITVLKEDALEKIVQKAEDDEIRRENELLSFAQFCRNAQKTGEWVIHFGV